MTDEQIKSIQSEKGAKNFPLYFILDCDRKWRQIQSIFSECQTDLSKIRIVYEGKDEKRNTEFLP